MTRRICSILACAALFACGSGSSSSGSTSDGGGAKCPNIAGTYKITAHCDASLVGQSAVITQNDCSLSFAPPFSGFTGTVTSDDKITLSGPQTCTGTVAALGISMSCTPGTCNVKLEH